MGTKIYKGKLFNYSEMEKFKSGFPADLTQDYSPSIPKDFPKDRIPSLL